MQALPVAIYTLLRGYLCPLPTAGWGIFLDLVFLVGIFPSSAGPCASDAWTVVSALPCTDGHIKQET